MPNKKNLHIWDSYNVIYVEHNNKEMVGEDK